MLLASCASVLFPGSRAAAAPQASLGLTVGGIVENAAGPGGTAGALHLGGRADALFLRARGSDMAVGPYLDVATSSFRDTDLGGGAEWLLPVRDDLPLVLSAGAFARNGEGHTWVPGLDATVFFGSRSYNFHSWYGLAVGLFAQSRWLPAGPGTMDLVFGVQLDAELLAMPALLVLGAVR